MPKIFSVVCNDIVIAVQADIFLLLGGSERAIEIISFSLSQALDVGVGEKEMLGIECNRYTDDIAAGSTATEQPHVIGDASDVEVGINGFGSGTVTTVFSDTFNVQIGYLWRPAPRDRHWIRGSAERWGVRLEAPVDPLTHRGTLTWAEHG